MSQNLPNDAPPLIVVEVGGDNSVKLNVASSEFRVEIVDIDMILIFEDGSRIVVPGLALKALQPGAPVLEFTDRKIPADDLLSLLGEVEDIGKDAKINLSSAPEEAPPTKSDNTKSQALQAGDIALADAERAAQEERAADTQSQMTALAQPIAPPPAAPAPSAAGGSPAPAQLQAPLGPVAPDALIFTIDENSGVGSIVGSMRSAAPEAAAGAVFRLVDDAGGRFAIDPSTGQITVVGGSLDYEADRAFTLLVSASNGAVTQTVTIAINLRDVNEAPTALELEWVRPVQENVQGGVGAALVRAVDPDQRDQLTYSLVDDAGGRFEIDARSGLIRTAQGGVFDYETAQSHAVTVRVTDLAGHTFESTFLIEVSDQNEAPSSPTLTEGGAVMENAAAGVVVARFSTVDPDHSDTVVFSLADNAGGRFEIDPRTGEVRVADGAVLDFEQAALHRIVVRATDADGLYSDTLSIITVNNAAEAPRDLQLVDGGVVREDALRGSFVGAVRAQDQDFGDRLTYVLVDDAGGRFIIDPASGMIRVADPPRLDADENDTYTIIVRASDLTGLTTEQTITINVLEVNEAPLDLRMVEGGNVAESAGEGFVVARMSARDPDADDRLTYHLVDDFGGLFEIDPVSGEILLSVGAALDFEAQPFYDVQVGVRDRDGLEATTRVRITVSDVNEGPSQPAFVWGGDISEQSINGVAVGQVRASDPDAGERLTYSLVDSAGGRFVIDALTGVVRVGSAPDIDFEVQTEHQITVRATDRQGLSSEQVLTVVVTDANEAPSTPVLTSGGAVVENAAAGIEVARVGSSDPDRNESLTYVLVDSAGGRFAIDAATGVITTTQTANLDHELNPQHTVRVRAIDSGGLFSESTFTINVQNIAEAPTQIIMTSGGTLDLHLGQTIAATFRARDPDIGDEITYSLSNNADGRFTIDPVTGALSVANPGLFVNTPVTSYAVSVVATDSSGLTREESFAIRVTNVNDAPYDLRLTSGGFVSEDELSGVVVGQVRALDPDLGDILTYSLVDDANGRFVIDAATGEIRLTPNAPLDFEANASHQVRVRATDAGGLSAESAVTINVGDVNERPQILTPSLQGFQENAAGAALVVNALDPDAGTVLSYTLAGEDAALFTLDALGVLRFQAPPNYEAPSDANGDNLYEVTITVSDGALSAVRAFTIAVENVNEAPVITSAVGETVVENSPGGTIVGRVSAADQDAGDTITYSLVDTVGGLFEIDAATGVIRIATDAILDYEAATSHALRVRAVDSQGRGADADVTVTVLDGNEFPEITSLSSVGVLENTGGVVYTVTASDDPAQTLTYGLQGADAGHFTINPTTGAVSFKAPPDFELRTDQNGDGVYSIVVTASDGTLTAKRAVSIQVNDVNEAPSPPMLETGGSVSELANGGAAVGTVRAIDPDAGDAVRYSLVDDAGGRFTIDDVTGVIRLSGDDLIDAEAASSHTVRVRATDSSGLAREADITLTVINVNEGPNPAQWMSGGATLENAAVGAVVGVVAAVDPDGGDTISYSLTDDGGGRFAINATTGVVTVANGALLDFEAQSQHTIRVRATDSGGLASESVLTVGIGNVNEAPGITSPSAATAPENATGAVYVASAADPDAGTVLVYSLSGDDAALFAIDSASGAVRFLASPDFESPQDLDGDNIYTVVVTSSDGILSDSKAVSITVQNVNEAPDQAQWQSGGATVENAAVGSIVGVVRSIDPDASDVLTYSLVDNAGGRFEIDQATGEVRVAPGAVLNFEAASAHQIRVQTTDAGGLTSQSTLTVTLSDINEAPTILSGQAVTVDEYAGGVAYQTVASDPDFGSSISFSLAGADAALFSIDSVTGAVSFLQAPRYDTPLDANGDNIYDVQVTASDGLLSSTLALSVTVANVNEAPTVTSAATVSVAEGLAGVVYTVSGTDPDPGTKLVYSISGADAGRFDIDSSTGAVTFRGLPDFETPTDDDAANSYDIVVTASDGILNDSKSVRISVSDINEAPGTAVWQSGGAIGEFSAAGAVVGQVRSLDQDAGDTVTYALVNDAGGRFTIDAVSGEVTVAAGAAFDFEVVSQHAIVVRASDSGGLSQDTVLTVTITNENEAPTIVSASAAVALENTAGQVYRAEAIDLDPGSVLLYSISGGDSALFAIDASTGVVTFKTPPNFEAPSDANADNVYDFTVTVSDGQVTDSRNVAIQVLNVNEAPTVTTLDAYAFAENGAGVVFTATSSDPDAGASVFYTLTGPDAARFDIHPTTGAVTMRAVPNFEAPLDENGDNAFQITVVANDGALTGSKDVTVTITDVNEAPGAAAWLGGGSILETATAGAEVGRVFVTDPDANDSVTYSLPLNASGRFQIDPASGIVTLVADGLLDADVTTSHSIRVRATDSAGLTRETDLVVTVINANEAPVITSSDAATFVENATGEVYRAIATDPDAGTQISFSLAGADADFFEIDPASGSVTFKTPPNFEARADFNGDNNYDIVVFASDGALSSSKAVRITLTDINEAPQIVSSAAVAFAENGTGVAYATIVSDPDAGSVLSYVLGGADAALFTVDQITGALRFAAAPNFESPQDVGADNVYDVTVTASDGQYSDTKSVSITVSNVNEAPFNVRWTGAATVAENAADGVVVATAAADDPDAADLITWSLTNDAGGRFVINSSTGVVSVAPDATLNFESQTSHSVTVRATDAGGLWREETLAIQVTNVNEAPGPATWLSGGTVLENSAVGTTVGTVAASDQDAGDTRTYTLLNNAGGRFAINATTGVITVASANSLNFEAAADHTIVVRVTDAGGLSSETSLVVGVININEAPTVTSQATSSVAENSTGVAYQATAVDADAGDVLTYSISGTDASVFTIDAATGVIRFINPPNFEAAADANGDNQYVLTLSVSDGQLSDSRNIVIGVTNVNEAPSVTSAGAATVSENTAGVVYTATANDPDAGAALSFSIHGADASLFDINGTTGEISFKAPPNFEAPLDQDADNVYEVIVRVSDGELSADRPLSITVSNVNEAPTLTSSGSAMFQENAVGGVYTATAVDPDANSTLTFSLSGADAARFNLDPTTGVLTFKNAPDFEAPTDAGGNNIYDVVVTVSDGQLTASRSVAIAVTNRNEAPTITSLTTATMAENGTGVVYTATATDPDAGSSLTYALSGADAGRFAINALTGEINFIASPNFEAPTDSDGDNVYDLIVTASDGQLTASQGLAITVTNVNETPTITSASSASFAENGVGVAYTAVAQDPDAGTTLVYSISGADAARFNINALTGAVTFKAAPNFEASTDQNGDNAYEIVVTASDGQLSVSKAVTIAVTNVNEAPTVTSAMSATFSENASGVVYAASATDPDAGAVLSYVLSGADANLFDINASTGAVTFKVSPNFEAPADVGGDNVYDIIVTASDGSMTGTRAVAISVDNVNEAPGLASWAAGGSLQENAAAGTFVGMVQADDVDANDTLTYGLVSNPGNLFAIDAASGMVTVASGAVLNFEAASSHTIRVSATDAAGLTSQTDLVVTITNQNEAPVIGSGFSATTAENNTGTVYTVAAADPDAGSTLTYGLTGTDAARFNINAATGAISFKAAPDFEAAIDQDANNVYEITVTASDGQLTATRAVTISVTNVNEAPIFTSASSVSIGENTAGGIYNAIASDPDAGASLTYAISGDDAHRFAINPTTGVISFLTPANFESPQDVNADNVYQLVVTASDGALSTTHALSVTVTNVNEAPTVTSAATATFQENGVGVAYASTASDPDANTTLSYALSGADANRFTIDPATGQVTFKTPPNFEAPTDANGDNAYEIVVTASDGLLSHSKSVTVTVTNANETPTITSASSATFAENGAGAVYTIQGQDPDAGTNLTYAISGADAALFNVNPTTGVVTFKAPPNFEAPQDNGGNNVYTLDVIASDGALSVTQAISITVTDVNEAPEFVSGGVVSVAENTTGAVYVASAPDPDAGNTVTYAISGADADRFSINASSGAVSFKSAPNFEAPADVGADNTFDIVITATDGSLSSTKSVAISVTNVNEAPGSPYWSTGGSVSEDAAAGAVVGVVLAADPDASDTRSYALVSNPGGHFTIDAITGAVSVASGASLDFESAASHVIRVRATDAGGLTSEANLTITVTNVNEAPVVTSGAASSIAENATGVAYQATATDPDASSTLTFSLSGADATRFDINASTGAVTFKSPPNFEAPSDADLNNAYEVMVVASDGQLSTSRAVTISVTNVNEAPSFSSGTAASFVENGAGVVYTAVATDPDTGATITYSLSGADAGLFDINGSTGAITFKAPPNFEAPSDAGADGVYDVVVTASDGALSATRSVAITVTNQNEAPSAPGWASGGSVQENASGGTVVGTVASGDPDTGDQRTYALTTNPGNRFAINATTGVVTVAAGALIDFEANTSFVIRVTTTDSGGLTSAADLVVSVTNQNEAPAITSAATGSADENTTSAVYTATATDPDAGAVITYSLSGGDSALFDINSSTGAVTFKSAPNFESPADADLNNVYEFTVIASDGVLSSSKAVALTVVNVNEAPIITSSGAVAFAENGAGTVYTTVASDPDGPTAITYSLGGADAGLFTINAAGVVTFKAAPNFESPSDAGGDNVYDLVVSASDGSATSTKVVAVTVTNANEAPNAPAWASGGGVSENAAAGTIVGTIAASDPDTGDSRSYTLLTNPGNRFAIDSTTGVVTVASGASLDFESAQSHLIRVRVTDAGGLSSEADLSVTVSNVNEAPVITSAGAVNAAENAVGVVYTVAAADPDANTALTYSLTGADATRFTIDATTGQVTFKAAPNFEAPDDANTDNVYEITVNASDGSLSGSRAVTITVLNINESPTFTSPNSVSFAENGVGVAYDANATDPENGALTYSLAAGDDSALFNIDPVTGEVRFNAAPNFEAPADANTDNIYAIVVRVSDGATVVDRAVTISVTDANEQPFAPAWASGGSVAENSGAGTLVGTVAATDPDANAVLTYALSNDAAGRFEINSTTGAVTVRSGAVLDFEAVSTHVVRVQVSDQNGATSFADLNVSLTNVNEAPSVTSAASATVAENGGGIVYAAAGNDPEGSALTWSLGGADASRFTINPTTGAVSFISPPDFEAPADENGDNVYAITVNASDGLSTTSKAVTINVTNVNEAPIISSGGAASTAENTTGAVYTAVASDPDAGQSVSFQLTGADAALFQIDPTSGVVTFKAAPNFEAPGDAGSDNVYDITVLATDGTLTASKAVAISVTNANEAPGAPAWLAGGSILETATAGAVVGTVAASDPDAANTLTYSLITNPSGRFEINASTGQITVASGVSFDFEQATAHLIRVRATDQGGLHTEADLTVSVTNANEAPTVTSSAAVTFVENSVVSAYVASATDPDANTTLSYSISGVDAGLFDINTSTGVVTFKSAPNFEAPGDADLNNVYQITITASDGSLTATKAVEITVTNANEAPSVTSPGSVNFQENATGVVYVATGSDPDASTTLSYSISGADAALFTIDQTSGELRFVSPPNFEAPSDQGANNIYDVIVTASDGQLTASRAVSINVTNANEAPVISSPASASFAENGAGDVYAISALDPDAGATVTYAISGVDAARFTVDATTGIVRFVSSPNFEAPNSADNDNIYEITVEATDGSLSSSKGVSITVTNVNEAPVISSAGSVNFAENTVGPVYTTQASDPDANTTLTYLLSGADANLFAIDATTGVVTFKQAPNFESPADSGADNIYNFTVTVSDGPLSASKDVAVAVTDVNESPVITSGSGGSVAENTAGTVYTITAVDPEGQAGLVYSISGGADAGLFTVNATTGAVAFATPPNYELPADQDGDNIYTIEVSVSDGQYSNARTVQFTVTDVQEAPVFSSGTSASFTENGTGVAYQANASGGLGPLTYSLAAGGDNERFSINATTGAVTFNASPNFEAPTDANTDNVYSIEASVTDGVTVVSRSVNVAVVNANEAPTVTSASTVSVNENASGVVYAATATDPDANPSLTYSISGVDAARFNIDANTGAVSFKAAPNYEVASDNNADNTYEFTVTVSDGALTATKAVTLTVADVNEAPVIAAGGPYSLLENSAAGAAVATIVATDEDAGQVLTYALIDNAGGRLVIDAATGVISVATGAVLDFEQTPNLTFTVRVSDPGGLNSEVTRQISLTDVNEAPGNPYWFWGGVILENSPGGAVVGRIASDDPDAGDNVTFTLTNDAAGRFAINSSTGEVSVVQGAVIDYEVTPTLTITVRATDTQGLTTDINRTISVLNVEDGGGNGNGTGGNGLGNGGFGGSGGAIWATGGTIAEIADSGSVVGRLDTGVQGLTVTWTYVSDPQNGLFKIAADGTVSLNRGTDGRWWNQSLDYESSQTTTVAYSAVDQNGVTYTGNAQIQITNVAEAPTGAWKADHWVEGGEIAENSAGGAMVGRVQGGTDGGGTIAYSLTDDAGGLFTIEAATGIVRVANGADLNFEAVNQHALVVKYTDTATGQHTSVDVVALVTNVNEAPVITSAGSASFTENAAGVVYQATVTDPDGATNVTYTLSGDDAALFAIDATTGAVTFKAAPDFEAPGDVGANGVFDIIVTATEGALSGTKAVQITLQNANDAPVVTSAGTATVAENTTGVVYTPTVTDQDGDTLQYFLSGADAALFSVNASTGAISFKTAPDFEAPQDQGANNVYDVVLSVSDGQAIVNTAIAITVENANDAASAVSWLTGGSIIESATAGASVGQVRAVDPDPGSVLSYALVVNPGGRFAINGATGEITLAAGATLDFESTPSHTIRVRAEDGLGGVVETDLTVSVTNANEAPSFTSGAAATVNENAVGAAYQASAQDPDAGASLSYSISGADAALFDVNAATGAVTFKAAPNYEAPSDTGADNVYDIVVTVSDGSLSVDKAVQVTVANINEAPVITAPGAVSFAENGVGPVVTPTVVDPEADTLGYFITGADAVLFNVDSSTGALSFKTPPNFEAPQDQGGDNVYTLTLFASDGQLVTSQAIAVTVTDANDAPGAVSWSSGGTIAEDSVAGASVGSVAAVDPDASATLSYALVSNPGNLFAINASTGAITVASGATFNFEASVSHTIRVQVSDGLGGVTETDLAVSITNVNEGPSFSVGSQNVSVNENIAVSTNVISTVASDPDAGTSLSYTLSGDDAARFQLVLSGGQMRLRFLSSPDREAPTDANADNVYAVTITASDGALTATQSVTVTVNNVNEQPTITSGATASYIENGASAVYVIAATDPENATLTYSLESGGDNAAFSVNATTGEVSFVSPPNFEAPTDAYGDNVYVITVRASDGVSAISTKSVTITVTNANEAPAFSSGSSASFAENAGGVAYQAITSDPDAATTISYTLGGVDAHLFDINASSGAVTFKAAPNYEAPQDNDANNTYQITVNASDGAITTAQNVTITVTDVNEAPTITAPASLNYAENGGTAAVTPSFTDPEGAVLQYFLTGADAGLFNVDALTGAISFKAAPNFEAPTDTGADNVYNVTLHASDGDRIVAHAVAITVTNIDEAPTVTSGSSASFLEGGSGTVYAVTATDPEGGMLTYGIVGGADAAAFNINASTGVVTFKTPPDHDTPTDVGSNNVYDIVVRASDTGGNSTDRNVAITVTNASPVISSPTLASVTEQYTGVIYRIAAADPAGGALTYSLSGADANDFSINASTGEMSFLNSVTWESPQDSNSNNVYQVNVRAEDADGAITSQTVQITVLNATSGADSLTGGAGDDYLDGRGGGDALVGAGGHDTAGYASASSGVALTLGAGLSGAGTAGDANGDTLSGIEHVLGSGFEDTFALTLGQGWSVDGGGGVDTVVLAANSGVVSFNDLTGVLSDVERLDFSASGTTASLEVTPDLLRTLTGDGNASNLQLVFNAGDNLTIANSVAANTYVDGRDGNGHGSVVFYADSTQLQEIARVTISGGG